MAGVEQWQSASKAISLLCSQGQCWVDEMSVADTIEVGF